MRGKHVILLLLGVMALHLVRGEVNPPNSVIVYYSQGKAVELASGTDSLLVTGLDLVRQSDLRYRLAVSDSLIKSIRQHDACLEIVLPEPLDLSTQHALHYRIDHLLVPFEGLYATDAASEAAVIFLGNGNYFSGPVGVSHGLAQRSRFHKLVRGALSQALQTPNQ